MEIILLNVLYVVLIAAVVVVGGLLAVLLWQAVAMVSQAREVFLPQLQTLLVEVHQNLKNTEDLTRDVNGKLDKLDGAVDAASSAVQSLGESTILANKAILRPLMISVAAYAAGLQGAAAYLRENRGRRPQRTSGVRTGLKAEKVGR